MALASLRFQRNAHDNEETRQGMTVFAGDATSFHEWQFRLQIKKSSCKTEELHALTAKVVDALRGEALSCAMEIGLDKLMKADGLDLFVQRVQARIFPQRTAEARELLKQGMRVGGPKSRILGEPMTSYISRRRRWWTLVREMDNTLELGGTVQGSMMLEQDGLSRFEQNMVLTHTRGQRTMTAIAEALLEQHYDVHHRGRETPALTGSSSSSNRWRRRDIVRAYLAEAEPIKESTDTAVYAEEGMPDDYDGEQDEPEDDEVQDTDLAAFLSTSGEDPEADDALAEALQLDAVAMVAWQRFQRQGQRQEQRPRERPRAKSKQKKSVSRIAGSVLPRLKSRTNCSSVRCARTLGRRRHLSQERQERRFAAATSTRVSGSRRRNTRFRLHFARWRYVCRCHSPGRPCTPRCQRHSGGDTAEGTARCETTTKTTACHSLTASIDTSVRWRMQRVQPSRHERHG